MPAPRGVRLGALAAAWLMVSGACLAGCAAFAPTPVPGVTVHLANRISNAVAVGSLFSEDPAKPAVAGVPLVLAPCAGALDVRAPIGNAGGGALTLFIDPSGRLDDAVARHETHSSFDPDAYELSIIWSDGELAEGDWLVVTPTEVLKVTAQPEPPSAECEPWATPPE